MEISGYLWVWLLGAGSGLFHAQDSDHLLALANYSPQRTSLQNTLQFCVRWAIGHGAAILSIGSAVLILKMAIPFDLAATAERIVGLVLLLLGSFALYHTARTWQITAPRDSACAGTSFTATVTFWQQFRIISIGFLHGTAGSAMLLALLPLTQLAAPAEGMGYLLCFSLGVLVAMMLFGSVLGGVLQRLQQHNHKFLRMLRVCIAVPAIVIGMVMLLESV